MSFIMAWVAAMAVADLVSDPIADYLKMEVSERVDLMEPLDHLDRVSIDVNGDGRDEVFVGSPYKYSGTMEVFWVGYEAVDGRYRRITPENKDILIGSFETIYAGQLTEISQQGLATAEDIVVDDPEPGDVAKVGALRFYYIANDYLVIEDRVAWI